MGFVLTGTASVPTDAGFVALDALKKSWVSRYMLYRRRTIPVVSTRIKPVEFWHNVGVRWGIGRNRHSLLPGLYAVGNPGPESPVFVTANYRMSFDALRSSLHGMDAWMLILDTKGVNVWCAAGKGSFGTKELVARIAAVKLASIVDHRRLILPQLGAPGVSAVEVTKKSGFRVVWGPVRAEDIHSWLDAGCVKSEAMREVRFTLRERMAVAPVELVQAWPGIPAAVALSALYGLPFGPGWLERAWPAAVILVGTVPVGTVVFPALLPWLPGKAFAMKGALLGAVWAGVGAAMFDLSLPIAAAAVLLAAPAVAFLGMNFTGCTTFTCQPGAALEVEKSVVPMGISILAGLALAVVSRLFGL
jgi:acetyl-CoA decarbonylase/synthase complex subunit gamma